MLGLTNRFQRVFTDHFPSMGNNLFISSSFGCVPYSQISNASAYFTCPALSFPYHFSSAVRTSGLMLPDLCFASHLIRSLLSFGTCSKKWPIQGNHSYICDSCIKRRNFLIVYRCYVHGNVRTKRVRTLKVVLVIQEHGVFFQRGNIGRNIGN